MAADFVEITATDMDPDWIEVYVGMPGTLARSLGPSLWCSRCHKTRNVQLDHVCRDILSGARRWARRGQAPSG